MGYSVLVVDVRSLGGNLKDDKISADGHTPFSFYPYNTSNNRARGDIPHAASRPPKQPFLMKKKLLLSTAIITAAVMPSVAQNNDPKIIGQFEGFSEFIIPSAFTNDGKSRIAIKEKVSATDEESQTYRYTIFDRNFKTDETFEITSTGVESWRKTYERKGDEWVLKYDFPYGTHYEAPVSVTPVNMDDAGSISTYDTETYIFSGFFTNTSEYLYFKAQLEPRIIEKEHDYDHDGVNDTREVSQVPTTIGYKIMSQSGKEICTISLPNGYTGDDGCDLYVMDGKKYMTCHATKEGGGSYTIIYEVDAATSSVRQMSAPIRVGVMPRVARRSEPVTVTFGDEGKASRRVKVTGMNGSTVIAESVAAGETATTIDTSALSQGVYVVTVEDGDKAVENCKIVIR